jgi:competence protein ComEC
MKAPPLTLLSGSVALLAGVVVVQLLPQLPPLWLEISGLLFSLLLLWRVPRSRLPAIFLCGAAWACLRADFALAQRLPLVLEGEDIQVSGTIIGLPQAQEGSTRFELYVETALHEKTSVPFAGHVRLNWYASKDGSAPDIAPCSYWQLSLRLKRPRGLINPGGFDFERHALTQGIVATGYVHEDVANQMLDSGSGFCIDRLRQKILQGIDSVLGDTPQSHVLRAMAFGDQAAMDEHEWAVARATGIPHLIAISGLHIALFAGFGVLLARLFWRLFPQLTLRWPAPMLEAPLSLMFALAYAMLAGFGLPTRRSLVMITAILVASFVWRARSSFHGLALAVLVLLIFDPLCVLSAGFWLSFVGVAWLILCLGGRGSKRHDWREMLSAQGIASIGLLPLTIWFFGQSSLVGPLANVLAVPVVCFVLLPFAVLGGLMFLVAPALGAPLLQVAGWVTRVLWWALEKMAAWPVAQHYFPEPNLLALLLALLGALWLLLPRGLPARGLGVVLFLPLLWPLHTPLFDGEVDITVLDVGQGLSVLVQTRDHAMVYDTGARFPSGFDLGEVAVVPAMRALAITHLDRLVISHGDNDHAGGTTAVVAAYAPDISEGSEPQRTSVPLQRCVAGEIWTWNEVQFSVVHPRADSPDLDNDSSCVVVVRSTNAELILTGDISSKVEAQVAIEIGATAAHTVLIVPHHGSKTSSSLAFLQVLHPQLAIASAGYRSRFGHPHPTVVARYAVQNIAFLNTASSGFIQLHFSAENGAEVVEQGRLARHPYWRE